MEQKVYKLILLPLAFLLFGVQVHATSGFKKTEYNKSFAKEFEVNSTDKFKVVNRFGKIEIKTWDEPRVKIDVLVTVNARSKEAADKILDRINVVLYQHKGISSAITEVDSKKSSWSSWWSNNSEDDFKIDYTVSMPRQHSLDLINKYGNTYLADIEGSADFSIKYGDLYAQNISQDVSIDLGYGTANMGSINNLNGTLKYAKLNMENGGTINMDSKYSKLTFREVGNMEINSEYDKWGIDRVENINFDGKYSDLDIGYVQRINVSSKYASIEVENCSKGGRIDLTYGKLKIKKLGRDFETLNVEGSYSGIKIHVNETSEYTLNAKATYAGVSYPDNLDVRREIKDYNSHEISGQYGSGEEVITINSKYGGITVW